ncbi:MAG TPA: hypothetical protein VGO59_18020 [Verrucomicrobiae bacterium]|jgi:hypothetical protein
MIDSTEVIRPEIYAAKLAALKNLRAAKFSAALAKRPRLIELGWWLQSLSMLPAGFRLLGQEALREYPDRIGTPQMHRIGKTDAPYTGDEARAIMEDVPGGHRPDTWTQEESAPALEFEDIAAGGEGFGPPCLDGPGAARVPTLEYVARQNHAYFFAFCRRAAQSELPWLLESFCAKPDETLSDPFWFHGLADALLDMMDAHAARAGQGIAMTRTARVIFSALQFAWDEKAMVKIIGDSRFGKTESVKAWCAMNQGKARMVKTPPTCCERSFLDAIADALGLARGLEVTTAKLRASIEYVLRHCGLLFVFDESAWLIPSRYTNKTTPVRLNYIRSQILDNGCPVALIETPQYTAGAAVRFEKTTGFNMTQWNGRIMRKVTLPVDLPEEDLFAVAGIHFPGFPRSCVKRIVSTALTSGDFLFAVEKIAKNARAVAREDGRSEVLESDILSGIRLAGFPVPRVDAAPSPAPDRMEAPPARRPAQRRQSRRAIAPAAAEPGETAPALEGPSRVGKTPIRETLPTLQNA